MNEQCVEVHETSQNWLWEALQKMDGILANGVLDERGAAQYWAAIAQEAACAAAIMVRNISVVAGE